MRFLHLSDLHFGKSIYGTSLIDSGDQPVWVDRFLELAGQVKPDAVVIAGDVYDRAQAPKAAARLLNHLITELANMKIAVMLIGGNHDSTEHLSFLSSLLEKQDVYIAKPLEQSSELVHATLEDEHGPVTFWLLPYVNPAMISSVFEDEEIKDYDTAVRRILAEQPVDFTQRNVLIAHQNVTADGVEVERGGSESSVGGIGQVEFTAFDGFDYVALGHIHSSYAVGRETVRYVGTPLAYHFNETRQLDKGPLLVTMAGKEDPITFERQVIEPLHRMQEIKGEYEGIRDEMLRNPPENEYLKIVLTDTRISPLISDTLHGAAKAKNSLLMELTSEYHTLTGDAVFSATKDMQEKPVEQLFAQFYTDRNNGIDPDEKDLELMKFVGELTRSAMVDQENPAAVDVQKILDFVMDQEVGRE